MHAIPPDPDEWRSLAIEHAADGWLLTDGAIVEDCNPQTEQILGLERAALIGRKLRDVAPGA
jgi:PAS domain S-box-containing protein